MGVVSVDAGNHKSQAESSGAALTLCDGNLPLASIQFWNFGINSSRAQVSRTSRVETRVRKPLTSEAIIQEKLIDLLSEHSWIDQAICGSVL